MGKENEPIAHCPLPIAYLDRLNSSGSGAWW